MILGIGSDIVDIRRIEAMLARHGSHFTQRVFTPEEIALAEHRPAHRAATYARRFAAKEACLKALGRGMTAGLRWHDMEVISTPSGKPHLSLSGEALRQLAALAPAGMQAKTHLTLSDEPPYALAFVVFEAAP